MDFTSGCAKWKVIILWARVFSLYNTIRDWAISYYLSSSMVQNSRPADDLRRIVSRGSNDPVKMQTDHERRLSSLPRKLSLRTVDGGKPATELEKRRRPSERASERERLVCYSRGFPYSLALCSYRARDFRRHVTEKEQEPHTDQWLMWIWITHAVRTCQCLEPPSWDAESHTFFFHSWD